MNVSVSGTEIARGTSAFPLENNFPFLLKSTDFLRYPLLVVSRKIFAGQRVEVVKRFSVLVSRITEMSPGEEESCPMGKTNLTKSVRRFSQ